MLYYLHDLITIRNIGRKPNDDDCAAVETCQYVIYTFCVRAFVGLTV